MMVHINNARFIATYIIKSADPAADNVMMSELNCTVPLINMPNTIHLDMDRANELANRISREFYDFHACIPFGKRIDNIMTNYIPRIIFDKVQRYLYEFAESRGCAGQIEAITLKLAQFDRSIDSITIYNDVYFSSLQIFTRCEFITDKNRTPILTEHYNAGDTYVCTQCR